MKTTQPDIRTEATIAALADIRRQWRKLITPDEEKGFRLAALTLFRHIENTTAPHSLWTTFPKEEELNENSRIGDHLSVTRQLLGFPP